MTQPALPSDWDDGDTLGSEDFNKHARRINDIYTANADDITRAVVEVTGAATLPAVAFTDYLVYLRAGAQPKLPTAIGNSGRYSLKNTTGGPITVAFTGGQLADGGPLVVGPYASVDVAADPVTATNLIPAWRII